MKVVERNEREGRLQVHNSHDQPFSVCVPVDCLPLGPISSQSREDFSLNRTFVSQVNSSAPEDRHNLGLWGSRTFVGR